MVYIEKLLECAEIADGADVVQRETIAHRVITQLVDGVDEYQSTTLRRQTTRVNEDSGKVRVDVQWPRASRIDARIGS